MSDHQIEESIARLKAELTEDVTLVAVSKTKPNQAIMRAYNVGHRDFGENKVQDFLFKEETLPQDIQWHFIGHLQTNKVKQIVGKVHLIHSVDSMKLLKEIEKRSNNASCITNCLLQVGIAQEETKFGLGIDELKEILSSGVLKEMKHIEVHGLMGMATNTEDESQIRKEFNTLHSLFEELKSGYFNGQESFKVLSMGMTSDYQIAVSEGSNMVRIGSLIFGSRDH
jgi:pyridoxal phosphate enzyme (YggS family)